MEQRNDHAKSQRARLTCSRCHRRKIKCDKQIPCGNCLKKGLGDVCNREEDVVVGQPSELDNGANDSTVRALLHRMSQLEAMLQQNSHTSTAPSERSQTPNAGLTLPASPDVNLPQDIPRNETTPIRVFAEASQDDTDAATVLEFLAWGRKKDSDFINAPEHQSGPRQPLVAQEHVASITTSVFTEGIKSAQLDVLEALLPSRDHISQLVEYHNTSLLWYHESYSSKTFSDDLRTFFAEYGASVRHSNLNLQWLALLFAILTGSMTCSSPSTCRAWGFSDEEQSTLSLHWYEATVTCLDMARYMKEHTIYSVQAIATLTIAAHILGNSNSQSVLLAAAGRIAQSLGLQRLVSDPQTMSADQLRTSEAGKRVFVQLCTQDWFQIPFSETYSLNPRFYDTVRPLNCNDDDMIVRPESIPTQASYCNYRYDIAALMPQLLDSTTGCKTMFTRYQQVLKYDDKMRKLATASMPTFLSSNAPVADEWPTYVSWGRRSLTICAAHKIIMIHRKFVGLSFNNTAFSFTRRTCLAASKTILREAFAAQDENGPVLWIDQAFSVAAGIILSLDVFHRTSSEREFGEHKQLVTDTIDYLKIFTHSKIAIRGVQVLSFLRQKLEDIGSTESRKRPHADESDSGRSQKRARGFDIQSLIRDVSQSLGVTSPVTTFATPAFEPSNNAWDAFDGIMPAQTGLDEQYLFENFFMGHMYE